MVSSENEIIENNLIIACVDIFANNKLATILSRFNSFTTSFFVILFKSHYYLIMVIRLKVNQCRYENLLISLSSYENNMPKVSHCNTVYFVRYTHPRYMKCLFTNIQKQKNILKSSLLFKKNTSFKGKYLENSYDLECEIFRLLLYQPEHIVKFSNLH